MMVEEHANASHAGSKKQKFQKVLIHDPEANLTGFFIFLEASLMNVECLGLQH